MIKNVLQSQFSKYPEGNKTISVNGHIKNMILNENSGINLHLNNNHTHIYIYAFGQHFDFFNAISRMANKILLW